MTIAEVHCILVTATVKRTLDFGLSIVILDEKLRENDFYVEAAAKRIRKDDGK